MGRRLLSAIVALGLSGCGSFETRENTPISYSLESAFEDVLANKEKLLEAARKAREEKIERGGVAIYEGKVIIYEIENDLRRDNQRFEALLNGNDDWEHFHKRARQAADMQSFNLPEATDYFKGLSEHINRSLARMRNSRAETDTTLFSMTWCLYDVLVMHNLYSPNRRQLAEVREKGTEVWGWHTHRGSPPSNIDLKYSHTSPEVVVSIDENEKYTLYWVEAGEYEVIETNKQP